MLEVGSVGTKHTKNMLVKVSERFRSPEPCPSSLFAFREGEEDVKASMYQFSSKRYAREKGKPSPSLVLLLYLGQFIFMVCF